MNRIILPFTQLSSITLCRVQGFSSFSAVLSTTVQAVSRPGIYTLNWKMLRKHGKWQNIQTLPASCPSAIMSRCWGHLSKTTYLRQNRQDQGRQQYLFFFAHHDVKISKSMLKGLMQVSEAALFSTYYQSLIVLTAYFWCLWGTAHWCSPWGSLTFLTSGSAETLLRSDIKATCHCLFLRKTCVHCCFFARERIYDECSILSQSCRKIWASTNGRAAPAGPVWLLLRKIIENRN